MEYILSEKEYNNFVGDRELLKELIKDKPFSQVSIWYSIGTITNLQIYNESDTLKIAMEQIEGLKNEVRVLQKECDELKEKKKPLIKF